MHGDQLADWRGLAGLQAQRVLDPAFEGRQSDPIVCVLPPQAAERSGHVSQFAILRVG
jgi:hypothetical protein